VTTPRTLFGKVWDGHLVRPSQPEMPDVLYIDLHLIHEVTSPQAFSELRARGLKVRRPDRIVATMDHSTPTTPRGGARTPIVIQDDQARKQIATLVENCKEWGIPLYELGDSRQGIVHVIGPEQGLTRPGYTIVCGDSHTSTHGAFGALAFGIGTSEVGHVLATQCLLAARPKTFAVTMEGRLSTSVTAKDLILALIAKIGTAGATAHVIEYRGSAIRALGMEERMTVCNMSIEAGARAGMVAPDETTFAYLYGRPQSPTGDAWDAAVARWRALPTDDGATFDKEITLDASALGPMITFGTSPGAAIGVDQPVPEANGDQTLAGALRYMAIESGKPLLGKAIDVVFIGSCTNGRLSDLQDAASVLRGRQVAKGVRALIVPGSEQVKKDAEALGLHDIFRAAGAEWREPGCSMCIAMNGDKLEPGQYAVSTSNRNFEGRQGSGGRTFLASPLTAAAAAVKGVIADPRALSC
jgi:3-isopropylmalate/(R)-2-methylmalate dehydratase large subunit